MRDRHFPRLCRSCQAPMARQEDACWRCGTDWATEAEPRTALRVISGGALTHMSAVPAFAGSAVEAIAAGGGRQDADRWADDGGL